MDENSPILDYASPRKRTRLRLPARSILSCQIDRDQITLSETLAGQEAAVFAILFACITLAITGFMLASQRAYRLRDVIDYLPFIIAAAEVLVMILLIKQTWRKTRLIVRRNEMLLTFSSAFYRKHYQWTGDDIADMLLIETANVQTQMPLAELLITRTVGGEIRLFTDHRADEIKHLIAILPPMLREGQCPTELPHLPAWNSPVAVAPIPAAPVAAAPSVDPTIGAMETSSRLVDRHRDLRNQQR